MIQISVLHGGVYLLQFSVWTKNEHFPIFFDIYFLRFVCRRLSRAISECPTWGMVDSCILVCFGWGKQEDFLTFIPPKYSPARQGGHVSYLSFTIHNIDFINSRDV